VFARVLDGRDSFSYHSYVIPFVAGKDIFKLDKLIFPMNETHNHWFCAVIYMQEKRIQFYDSMGNGGMKYMESLFKYVKDEHQEKKGSPLPDQDLWRLVTCTRDTPCQSNGTSLFLTSIFACSFCYSIYSHFIFRFGSITNQDMIVESSLVCLRTLLARATRSSLTNAMCRNAGNALLFRFLTGKLSCN
jgi:hypothetical protein